PTRGFLAVALGARDLAAKEDGVMVFTIRDRAERAHAPVAHHVTRKLGGLLDVTGSAARDVTEDNLFRDASAEQRGQLRQHPTLREVVRVLLRNVHRAPEGAAARDDGDLVTRENAIVHDRTHKRVSGLVVGDDLPVLVVHDPATPATKLDLLAGVLDVVHVDLLLVAASREKDA